MGLRLIGLAVADEAPDTGGGGVDDLPVKEVAVEPGLVDGRQRAKAHRDGRVLPEFGHEARMGVAGEPLAAHLETEVVQLRLVEAPLDEGSGVDAGGGVPLEIDLVAGKTVRLPPEEVVEAHLVQRCRRRISGEMTSDAGVLGVGPCHHDRSVPADVGADPAFKVLVAGEPRLLVGGDRVDVGGRHRGREADLGGTCPLEQLHEKEPGPVTTALVDDGVEGVEPLIGLGRVDVGHLVRVAVENHP